MCQCVLLFWLMFWSWLLLSSYNEVLLVAVHSYTSFSFKHQLNFKPGTHYGTSRRDLSLSGYTLENWPISETWSLWLRSQKSSQLNSWDWSQDQKYGSWLEFRSKIWVHTRGLDPEANPWDKSLQLVPECVWTFNWCNAPCNKWAKEQWAVEIAVVIIQVLITLWISNWQWYIGLHSNIFDAPEG